MPTIESMRLGADEYAAAFVGSSLVWSAGEAFNPMTVLPWLHVGWADDPDLLAANADGALVTSWPNKGSAGGSSHPATTGTTRPTMRHAVAGLNGHAGVQFNTAAQTRLQFNIADVAQPFRRVIVYYDPTATASTTYWGTGGSATTAGIGIGTTGALYVGMSSTVITLQNPAPAGVHIVSERMDGATSKGSLDGAGYITGTTATLALTWLGLGGSASASGVLGRWVSAHIAFWGVLDGSVTDAAVDALVDELMGYYEIAPP